MVTKKGSVGGKCKAYNCKTKKLMVCNYNLTETKCQIGKKKKTEQNARTPALSSEVKYYALNTKLVDAVGMLRKE